MECPDIDLLVCLADAKGMAAVWDHCKSHGVNPIHIVTAAMQAKQAVGKELAKTLTASEEKERWDAMGMAIRKLRAAMQQCPLPGDILGTDHPYVITLAPARSMFPPDIREEPGFVDLPRLLGILEGFAAYQADRSSARFAKRARKNPEVIIFCRSMALTLADKPDDFPLIAVIGTICAAVYADKDFEIAQVKEILESGEFAQIFKQVRSKWRSISTPQNTQQR